jgi:hypothetical protein
LIEPSFKEKCATIVGSNSLISIATDMAAFEQDVWSWYRDRAAFVLAPRGKANEIARILVAAGEESGAIVPQDGGISPTPTNNDLADIARIRRNPRLGARGGKIRRLPAAMAISAPPMSGLFPPRLVGITKRAPSGKR